MIGLGANARTAFVVLLLLACARTPVSAADTGAGVIALVVRASSGCFSASIRVAGMLVARTEALVIPEVEGYRVVQIPITSLTLKALENSSLPFKPQERCKNFYALGLMYWL